MLEPPRPWRHACLSAWLLLTLVPSAAPQVSPDAAPAAVQPAGAPDTSCALSVTARNGLVSVKADNAPLHEVIERIGQALQVPVESRAAADERVSDQFEDLRLDEALKRLNANYAAIKGEDGKPKIVLSPTGQAPSPTTGPSQDDVPKAAIKGSAEEGQPFEFDMDPFAVDQEDEENH